MKVILYGSADRPYNALTHRGDGGCAVIRPSWKEQTEKEAGMRTFSSVIVGFATLALVASTALAQGNGRGDAKLTLNGSTISIDYGRPSLKGRSVDDLLGQLPVGKFWRLGADTSTTFTTTGNLMFGSVMVDKGVYSLWAKRTGEKEWALVFNSQHGQWGTSHDPSKDVKLVPLKMETESKPAEQVTISLEKEKGAGELSVEWGTMELTTTFTTM